MRRSSRTAAALLVLVAGAAMQSGAISIDSFLLAAIAGVSSGVAAQLHRNSVLRAAATRADAQGPWTYRLRATLLGEPGVADIDGWLTLRANAVGFFPFDHQSAQLWHRDAVTLTSEPRRLRIQLHEPLTDWTLAVGEDLAPWADVRASRRPLSLPPPARVVKR